MKKLLNLLSVGAIAALAFFAFMPNEAEAQFPGIEDTWNPKINDCVGDPTDCLDTIGVPGKKL